MTANTQHQLWINSRYQLKEKLGQGGMGVVYHARDGLTGETVALKQVTKLSQQPNASPVSEEDLRLALAHEFQLLAGLRHPHIISVLDYGFGSAGEQPFFTMRYLADGQPLLLAGENQSIDQKLRLIEQLLQALAYLHRRGVLHRDLKPDNVLVQHDTVRVLDFGLAIARDTHHTTSAGTFLYMAPELFEGIAYSERSDLFAVGVLMTQLLTDKHPFAPVNYAFLDRVLDAEPDLDGMETWLQPFVQRLLAKNPDYRFENANHAIERLSDLVKDNLAGTDHFGQTGAPKINVLETEAIRESYLQAATFVGREDEMAQLQNALAQAQAGQGTAWLVGGESGVGKSRLLREVRTHALVSGFLVMVGQATENSAGGAYELWRAPLRQLVLTLPHVGDLDAGVLLPIVPDIAELLGRPVSPAPTLDGEATQIRLFVTIATLFTQATQPIFLILEDLHWAEAALLALPYLARMLDESSLVMVGSYRDDERPELAQTLSDMQALPLARLTEENMADLSVAMLGKIGQRPDILQRLQQETEGNAFFAVEVLRVLAEDMGGLGHIGDAPLPDMLLPDGIQSIVQRRLARVPQQDHHLLQLAAVAGRILDMRILQTLNDDSHSIPERWLNTCAEASMLDVVDDTWRFQHAKMRDGLLAMMPAETIKQHHQQVAQAIETVYPDDPRYAAQLVVHWRQAECPDKELTYAYLAGSHAASQYANEDAIAYLTNAYQLACRADRENDEQHPKQQYDVLCQREEVYALTGQPERQKEDIDRLAALIEALDQPEYHADVALRQANYAFSQANHDTVHLFAKTAIAHAQLTKNDLVVISAYRLMGEAWSAVGEYNQAKTMLTHAFTLAENLAQNIEMGKILVILGRIANIQSEFDHAAACHQQSIDIHTAIAHEQGRAQALQELGNTTRLLANFQQAQAYLEESLEIFERIGDKTGEAGAANDLAVVYADMGKNDTVFAYYQRAITIMQKIGNKSNVALMLCNLGIEMQMQGQIDKAYDQYLQALDIANEVDDKRGQMAALLHLGEAYRNRKGVFEQAKKHLEQSIALGDTSGMVNEATSGRYALGVLFKYLGVNKLAQSHFEEALERYRKTGMRYFEAGISLYLGQCLSAQQIFEQAKQHLHASITMSRELELLAVAGSGLNELAWIAYQEGDYEKMSMYYREALATLQPSKDKVHHITISQAGVALATLLLNNTGIGSGTGAGTGSGAEAGVESGVASALAYIASNPSLLMQLSPFSPHLLCYKLLHATSDPRVDTLLTTTHEQIQQIASYIETPEWQASFLSNVPEQRELEELYAARFPHSI
ncbi:MAG: tetratricopeptide repeat protein [Chloroflexota bacterium]